MIAELEVVALTKDIPASGLATGDVGTVVHRLGRDGYEVEFVTGAGETVALISLGSKDIRPLDPTDILHARKLKE